MVSLKVGFLKMDICILYSVLFIEFNVFDSISEVKCGVEICKNGLYISLGGMEDEKNVIYVTELVYMFFFFS
jgi:hypothetical protein